MPGVHRRRPPLRRPQARIRNPRQRRLHITVRLGDRPRAELIAARPSKTAPRARRFVRFPPHRCRLAPERIGHRPGFAPRMPVPTRAGRAPRRLPSSRRCLGGPHGRTFRPRPHMTVPGIARGAAIADHGVVLTAVLDDDSVSYVAIDAVRPIAASAQPGGHSLVEAASCRPAARLSLAPSMVGDPATTATALRQGR